MTTYVEIDKRIGMLSTDVSENLRHSLTAALCILRDVSRPALSIMEVGRLIEGQNGLLEIIETTAGLALSSKTLSRRINELARLEIITSQISFDLHWIRDYRNPVAHGRESGNLGIDDAEKVLDRALCLVEWFYCKCEHGPQLSSIYSTAYQPVTLFDQIVKLDTSSAHLLKLITTTLMLDEAGEPRLREGADSNQLKVEPYKLREKVERALSRNTEMALQLAYGFSILLDYRGQRYEALEALRKTLDLVLERGQDAPIELQIRVLDRAAHLANKQAYCDEAEKYAWKILELSRKAEQGLSEATALQRLGRSNYFRCDSQVSQELLEESLIIFQNLKDFRGIAWAQFDLGMLEVNQNDLTSARYWLEKSVALHRRNEDGIGEGIVRVNLAFTIHKQGDWKTARAYMTKAEGLLKGNSYHRWYLHFLGRLDIGENNLNLARNRFRQSLEIFLERGDTLGVIRSLLGFSLLTAKESHWGKAVMLLGAEEATRKREFGIPFPPDWEEEKKFIETGAREAVDEAAFDTTFEKGGAMTLEQAIKLCLA